MRAALAARDFRRVYRLLQKIGYTQQRIAALTGQVQSEVSAILYGRKVTALDVLERIVQGLRIPPPYTGLACNSCTAAARTSAGTTPTAADSDHDASTTTAVCGPRTYTGANPGTATTTKP